MDFLDPKKQLHHRIIILSGYALIAIAILIGTVILLYQAYGFGLNKNGQVIQNGLLFFSSQPHPAQIYMNGSLNKAQTNTRVAVPAGRYYVQIERGGYRTWQRTITVQGGDVQHFDYPLLFPKSLTTTSLASYDSVPALDTQSPDRRWLVVEKANSWTDFDLYDLKHPAQAVTGISLPSSLLSNATTTQSWQLVEWSNDNRHILLQHNYAGGSEYVLVDVQNPDQSVNLNKTLNSNPTAISLNNKKYDQYYIYNSSSGELSKATLKTPTPTAYQSHVLAYKSYSDDTMLYVTDTGAAPGKVEIKMRLGDTTYQLREVPAGSTYLMDMASYSGTPYVVVGAASENKLYIYKDPIGQLRDPKLKTAAPIRVLRVESPNYVSFSPNTQFIVAENGQQFSVFDAEHTKTYTYNLPQVLDAPQPHASWMDGDRLTYVSGGKLLVFDYDRANNQTLMPALPNYLPAFDPSYHYVYAAAPSADGKITNLTQTALLTQADL